MASKDITAQRFGKLVAIRTQKGANGRTYWLCRCDCGREKPIMLQSLTSGKTKACGCLGGGGPQDLTGRRFGKLVALHSIGVIDKTRSVIWRCLCDCGNHRDASCGHLNAGAATHCGCFNVHRTHGETKSKMFNRWSSIKNRCTNPRNYHYANYGGRGITICDEWSDSYEAFKKWALANGYEEGLQLDRIDNEKGYSPENCRYVTPQVNCNNKRTNKTVEYRSQTFTIAELSRYMGVADHLISTRLKKGWSVENAVHTPSRQAPVD